MVARAVPVTTGFEIPTGTRQTGSIPLQPGQRLRAAYLAGLASGTDTGTLMATGWLQLTRAPGGAQLGDGTTVIMNLDQGNIYEGFAALGGAPDRGNALEWEGDFLNSSLQTVYVTAAVLNDGPASFVSAVILTAWIVPAGG